MNMRQRAMAIYATQNKRINLINDIGYNDGYRYSVSSGNLSYYGNNVFALNEMPKVAGDVWKIYNIQIPTKAGPCVIELHKTDHTYDSRSLYIQQSSTNWDGVCTFEFDTTNNTMTIRFSNNAVTEYFVMSLMYVNSINDVIITKNEVL